MRASFVLAMMLTPAAVSAQMIKVFNPSFETPVALPPPATPTGVFIAPTAADQGAGPSDSPWVFEPGTTDGFTAAGTSFFRGPAPTAPDGNQWLVMFAQSTVAQALNFPTSGLYTVSFDAALNPGVATVFIDHSAPITLTQSPPSGSGIVAFTATFDVTAGTQNLTFVNNDDSEAVNSPLLLIDAVTVTPEPAWCGLLVPLFLLRRRRVG